MTRLLAAFSLGLILLGNARADNWPQWRGPATTASATRKNLPTEWSGTKNIAWKLKMPGMGGSTPAVWGDRMFLTSADDNKTLLSCASARPARNCGSASSARQGLSARGTRATAPPPRPAPTASTSTPSSAPASWPAYDFDGKEVWKFNAQERYGKFKIQFGMHTHAGAVRRSAVFAADPLGRRLGRRHRQGHRQGRLEGRPQERRHGRKRAFLRLALAVAKRQGRIPDHPRQRLCDRAQAGGRQRDLARGRAQPEAPQISPGHCVSSRRRRCRPT